jgi:DNA-binding transcriptional LysR family regulator
MELRQLYTFRTIATLGSFNKAAEVLNYAQSTVSEQIKALETDLNARLFNREGKQVVLTSAGELLLEYSQKMLNLEDEIRTEISNCEVVRGSLTIRIPETISSYYLPPILKKFHNRYPRVNLNITNCSYLGLHEELRSGLINLAFLISDSFREIDLEVLTLREIPLVLVTYPNNPLVSKQSIFFSDLINELVYKPSSDCSYFKMIENIITDEKIELSMILFLNSIEAIKRNIIGGTGVAVFPKITVQKELSEGLLVELPLEFKPLVSNIMMIWLKNKWHPPILEAFIDMVKEEFSSI